MATEAVQELRRNLKQVHQSFMNDFNDIIPASDVIKEN